MSSKTKEYTVVIERDEDGFYVASVPALHGCHTQARSLDVLTRRVKEVIQLCLEESGTAVEYPEVVGTQLIEIET